ncbi:MAG: 2-C-methyl-D-erythritol 4-phosphate cytidylyltransferase [Rikenellaceae bacterium]
MEQRIEPRVGVVIVAGGKGLRMGGSLPKQFRFLGQLPILAHSINTFAQALSSVEIVVVLPAESIEYWQNLSSRFTVASHRTVEGGEERFHSVKRGAEALSEGCEIIAVHDGVRPLCSEALIQRCVKEALASGSAVPVVSVVDSFREVGDDGISKIVDRSKLRAVQTPQLFDAVMLRRAYAQPYKITFTDDASLVESLGERVWLVEGERSNIKITTPEDMLYAEAILESKQSQGRDE